MKYMGNANELATKNCIIEGRTVLGIELGSTRIKAVLIGDNNMPISSGGFDWENRLENGVWTYSLEEVHAGLQASFNQLSADVHAKFGVPLKKVGAIGISAMMHGYLAFDGQDKLLVPFRTWRNTMTEQAAAKLTGELGFNIPQRWSIAHLYQAILNNEPHVKDIAFITTLAGYVHWQLTGERVLGVGDASGMFPIYEKTGDYNMEMAGRFDALAAGSPFDSKITDILPRVLSAGEKAGTLTGAGALLLDPTGQLEAGVPLCPPEGDAGTGMVATNSVAERTGNVSAGTSIFAMVVLERALSRVYPEIDMVTTPSGRPVAMAHCNNCTSDFDAWVKLFGEVLSTFGADVKKPELYDILYNKALEADTDCGGLLAYNYFSGEHMTGLDEGRPLLVRQPNSRFTLPNLMRSLLFSLLGTLKLGMDILTEMEQVRVERMLGHGGLFKTKDVGQKMMAAALNVPVAVMQSAGEGGAWGIALLAGFMANRQPDETLEAYLADKVFAGLSGAVIEPDADDVKSFRAFMEKFVAGLDIERAAVEFLK